VELCFYSFRISKLAFPPRLVAAAAVLGLEAFDDFQQFLIDLQQNRRQKVLSRGVSRFCGGA